MKPAKAFVAGFIASVIVSPTRDCLTSLTPVIKYPTSPTPKPLVDLGSGEITPMSNSSWVAPDDIILIFSLGVNLPSITLT